MSETGPRPADRVESFVAAIDRYDLRTLDPDQDDNFRVLARFVSRSVDGRYLDRHPADELLPALENLTVANMARDPSEIKVQLDIVEGSDGTKGILTSCMADQLFIYSVVRLALERLGIPGRRRLNCVVPIQRGSTGNIVSVGGSTQTRESWIWAELEGKDLASRSQEIVDEVRGRLQAACAVVADFAHIQDAVARMASNLTALAQATASNQDLSHSDIYRTHARLLHWLLDNNFVFLGTRFLPADPKNKTDTWANLGCGKFDDWRCIEADTARDAMQPSKAQAPFLAVHKSATESWIYRQGRLDHVSVQVFDPKGVPQGLWIIEGVFSFEALAKARTTVPILDGIIEDIYSELKATKGSHRYRTIRNAFNSLPLEYLFALEADDVRQLVCQILDVDADARLQMHISSEKQSGSAFVFLAVPRSHYSDELRAEIRKLLQQRFAACAIDGGVFAGNPESVCAHFFLTGAQSLSEDARSAIRQEIEHLASPWTDRLLDQLRDRLPAERAKALHHKYNEAFPLAYRENTSAVRAVSDIIFLENLTSKAQSQKPSSAFDVDIYAEKGDTELGLARVRMYAPAGLLLTDVMPVLHNLGLVVLDQFPTTVNTPDGCERLISTFRVRADKDLSVELLSRRNRLSSAIRAVITGAMDNDPYNRLLLAADIPWTAVCLVRVLAHYARQIKSPYGQATIREALLKHGDIVRALTELFRAKFDPSIAGQNGEVVDDARLALVERTRTAAETLLRGVADLKSDQVLRTFANLIEATVRTNFYAREPFLDPSIVLKLIPAKVDRIPEPVPYREIYVHHPLVEGSHLRGGPVARGGLRWSDRRADFRTEVLGLMATQRLKNVLIIPDGAKGAFVLRNAYSTVEESREASNQAYTLFVEGLLKVTDNRKGDAIVTPKGVIAYDELDPYLVVAADKGTAHQSDRANGIAQKHDFWLGDAFASGGSQGYDHKKEGITARGAWECVKRHFYECDLNPERDPIQVVGIGDMSGDVFGNGMLLSSSIHLLAAFDHRHVFIDPNPDPQKSFEARKALFAQGRSSWLDYPKEAMSPGGGIYPRGAKAIQLSPEAQKAFGLSDAPRTGQELICDVLQAKVDLLWNGGIGTYIKASHETHLDVDDPANDSVRIDASCVQARVIGEGGNLGITPSGRVELAERGVRLNTDALDNSAGVDLSDHEVNLKILFQASMAKQTLNIEERNQWLTKLKAGVCAQVLADNWQQSRTLSLDEIRSQKSPARFQRTIQFLSEAIPFRRRDMLLPNDRVLRQRAEEGKGLFRPELAVLNAHAKRYMRQELERAPSFDLQRLQEELFSYFLPEAAKAFREEIQIHPLGQDIARTMLTNRIVGDAGVSWLPETQTITGQDAESILNAYFTASRLLGAPRLKALMDQSSEALGYACEYAVRLGIERSVEKVCAWILRHSKAATSDSFGQVFNAALRDPDPKGRGLELAAVNAKIPQELREPLAFLPRVDEALDLASLVQESQTQIAQAGAAFYDVGLDTGLLSLIRRAMQNAGTDEDALDRPARFATRSRLRSALIELSRHALQQTEGRSAVLALVSRDLAPMVAHPKLLLSDLVVASDRITRHLQSLSA